ncbi:MULTISPECIES: extracellular solute-binding protein [unclassified Actinomyces]|uniref:extracellular solute-binding protein n=1 Tax=unclassified Actinomyces TaxID=2609248 RepID=UPI002017C73F|nr:MULTISPECIES: extracellular solute-binding protein [unclassified Actinomyces]MCL3777864.1 extracellular solute-binding protein [Actinomyces sp. AC-20-1]MCL3789255.1 extracellular solute-binding protein [Actinomyces sp. 187325]MCL3791608.1 extracellular solute-binding protein [Actinomyces sp. 186855]MCL3793550.1 extracellular solute-binding protein [Actinomyces sp. 217892]
MSRRHALTAAGLTALTAALAACSSPESHAGAGSADNPVWDADTQEYVLEEAVASGEAHLRIWVEYEEYGKALKKAFEAKFPGTVLDYEIVAKVDAVDRMSLDGEAGTGPDVYMTNFDDLAQAVSSSLAGPMGEYAGSIRSRCGDSFTSIVEREGELYGVPVSTESIALFYNKTLLKELTGSDQPATTWEEIIELARTYNDKAANRWTIRFLAGQIYYAYCVLSSAGWHLYPDGDLANPDLTATTMTDGLEYYKSLREIWDVNSADATYDYIENEFIKGQTPYVITGPWVFSDFDAAAEAQGFEYGVTTLPMIDGGQRAASFAGLAVGVVSGYSTYPAAARVLANFLASAEGAEALYSSVGAIPALTEDNLADVPGLGGDERVAGVLSQAQQADFVKEIPEYMYTAGDELVSTVWDGIQEIPATQERAAASYDELRALAS